MKHWVMSLGMEITATRARFVGRSMPSLGEHTSWQVFRKIGFIGNDILMIVMREYVKYLPQIIDEPFIVFAR